MRASPFALVAVVLLAALPAAAADLTVQLEGVDADGRFDPRHAFCIAAPEGAAMGQNISPALRWSGAPAATRSFVIIAHDPDVPAEYAEKANRPGVLLDAAAPRVTAHHWVLADIPATVTALAEGVEGSQSAPERKPVGPVAHGTRHANDFGGFFGDGAHGGWDGPCPPWNDALPHRYVVTVHALAVDRLDLPAEADAAAVTAAMTGAVLASGSAVATYSLFQPGD